MSIREPDFAGDVAIAIKQFPFYGSTQINAELALITAALASDVTTHDKTIEAPAAALKIHHEANTPFTDTINVIVNMGKAGNLSAASMIAAIDHVIGIASKPGVVDIPYCSANAKPAIVGTVCSVTNGNWEGVPTSYAYQWKRDGTTSIGTSVATYTLVSADVPGHFITCVVTATNAQGSTAAPPSNAVQT